MFLEKLFPNLTRILEPNYHLLSPIGLQLSFWAFLILTEKVSNKININEGNVRKQQ